LLSIPCLGIGQLNPATIASTPSSHGGDLVFILHAHHGFTKRIAAGAINTLLEAGTAAEVPATSKLHLALIIGPYGGKHLDFASYNTVVLISGSTEVTFTIAFLLDLASKSEKQISPVKVFLSGLSKLLLARHLCHPKCNKLLMSYIELELNPPFAFSLRTCRSI